MKGSKSTPLDLLYRDFQASKDKDLGNQLRFPISETGEIFFRELLEKAWPIALGITQNETEAQDLLQNLGLFIIMKMPPIESIYPWMKRVMKNMNIDEYRRERKIRLESIGGIMELDVADHRVSECADALALRKERERIHKELWNALIQTQSQKVQRIISMLLDGFTQKVIAKQLKMSPNAVHSAVSRFRKKLGKHKDKIIWF